MNLNQVTVPAKDIEASKHFYIALGLHLIVDAPHYARFEMPEGDSTFSISLCDGQAASGGEGAHVYFECDDLDERVAVLRARGVTFDSGPENKRWLWREAWLRDPSGNSICLYHAGSNRKNPPWRV